MLSVAKLSPGQEAYYESSVARGVDDYYAGRGESPGVWHGAGAATLDLAGVVGDGALGQLMRGVDPSSGSQLRPPVAVRRIRVEQLDAHTGERRLVERELRPVAGFDLVFGAPKSVSLLHALGDEHVRFEVAQAHQTAWHAALTYLEEVACVTRRGRNGVVRESGGGFVAAAFAHRTSRALEPHLHTHVIVANAARSPDGAWRALDGDLLLRSYRLAAGSLYQAQLRYELTSRLGVAWQPIEKGLAEIRGVPDAALQAFSTRRQQVIEHLAEHAASGWRAGQVAAVATRAAKTEIDLVTLRPEWEARAGKHGFGPATRQAVLGRQRWLRPSASEQLAATRRLLAPDGLTATQAAFSDADIVTAWAAQLPQGAPARAVRRLATLLSDDRRVVALDAEAMPVGVPRRFSTRQLADIEQDALTLALEAQDLDAPAVSAAHADRVIDERHVQLSPEQRTMVRTVATRGDGVLCVVGHAGAGKTTSVRALGDVLARGGVHAVGAAPSGVAAQTLERATGIPSTTLHRLVGQADRRGLAHRSVVVVDEAAMADTRTLHRLLQHADAAEAKVVLVGDPAQLGAVGPGGLHTALVERLGAVSLTDNHRQHHPAEQQALRALRDGAADDYLAFAARHGRLTLADTSDQARAALLADWHTAQPEEQAVMIAYRRADVDVLNQAARTLMRRDRRLGPDRHATPDGRRFAVGDQVICLHNQPHLDIANGTRGRLVDIRPDHLLLRTPSGDRRLPRRYADDGHLTHAYALTGHRAQGQTVQHAFVLAPDRGDLKEWAYVATSRARHTTRIYLATASLDPEQHTPNRPGDPDALERFTRAATRTANGRLATDPTRPSLATLFEQRQALQDELLTAQRAAAHARRALKALGPIRRRIRGPEPARTAEQAQTRVIALRRQHALLEDKIRTRQREFADIDRQRPTRPQRSLTRSLDHDHDHDLGR